MKYTKQIHGWKWATLPEFEAAAQELDTFYNLPNAKGDRFMSPKTSQTDEGEIDFYYVGKNKQIEAVFGKPDKFDITRL